MGEGELKCPECRRTEIDALASDSEVKRYQCKFLKCSHTWMVAPERPKDEDGKQTANYPSEYKKVTEQIEELAAKVVASDEFNKEKATERNAMAKMVRARGEEKDRTCGKCDKVVSSVSYRKMHEKKCKGTKVTNEDGSKVEIKVRQSQLVSMPSSVDETIQLLEAKHQERKEYLVKQISEINALRGNVPL
jgi:phage FluMu protein Com